MLSRLSRPTSWYRHTPAQYRTARRSALAVPRSAQIARSSISATLRHCEIRVWQIAEPTRQSLIPSITPCAWTLVARYAMSVLHTA
eukprot:2630010-Rhodomonas_salina.2